MSSPSPSAKKFDPQLISFSFRKNSARLFTFLDSTHLEYADAPTEFLGYARIRMAGYVSLGLISRFEIFENRFNAIWQKMRASGAKGPVHFVIASGTQIDDGFSVSSGNDGNAALTLSASPETMWHWHPMQFALSVQLALRQKGLSEHVNFADVRQALIIARNYSQHVIKFPLRPAHNPLAIHEGNPYIVRPNFDRMMVEVEVRTPEMLQSKEELKELGQKIVAAARKVAISNHATPYFRVYWKELLASIREAHRGQTSIGLANSYSILGASVLPRRASGDEIRGNPESLNGAVAWHLGNMTKLHPLEKEKIKKNLVFTNMLDGIWDAMQTLQKSRVTAASGFQFEQLRRCGKSDNYTNDSIKLASSSISQLSDSERLLHALTLSFSRESQETLADLLKQFADTVSKFQNKIKKLTPDNIWQMNWQFFPLTRGPNLENVEIQEIVEQRRLQNDPRSINFLILEMVALPSFRWDAVWISRTLFPPYSVESIQRALVFLQSNNMITFSKAKQRYVQVERNVKTGETVHGLAIADYHREMLALALASIDFAKPELRDIAGMTFALPSGAEQELKDLLMEKLREIFDLAGKDPNPETLFQMNLQLFPLTKG